MAKTGNNSAPQGRLLLKMLGEHANHDPDDLKVPDRNYILWKT